ncbi:MAG: transposase family protein [Betaproteobacteria bacterium]|nr:transposase family protein [Betaproteobacteria bacterium]
MEPVFSETERQRRVAEARKSVIQRIAQLQSSGGSVREVCGALLGMARLGTLDEAAVRSLQLCRDPRGQCSADGLPSLRSLQRLVEMEAHGKVLAPRVRQKNLSVPAWGADFLRHWQRPEKPGVSQAYRSFLAEAGCLPASYPIPSEHMVRRFLKKVGTVALNAGRFGERDLKSLRSFVRRDSGDLRPGDVYTMDGHCFDAEIRHPAHGRPFRPEITGVVDVATRKLVGWSVSLSESGLAVLDSLRTAALRNGIPAVLYVDRGSGYVNALIKDEGIGLLGRLGTEISHSLPYNSQARGVIERSHQTIWVAAAREIPGFVGAGMDRQARQAMFRVTRAAIKAGTVARLPLMDFDDFVCYLTGKVAEYNARPHRGLPKLSDPATGKIRHESPDEAWARHVAEGWAPEVVKNDHIVPLFRPMTKCAIRRCEITLHNKRYFSPDLEEFHGETLPVAFDIHDPQRVWVYDHDGRFILTAELDANKVPYMPMSFIEQAREKRAAAREKRLVSHLAEIREERNAGVIEQPERIVLPGLSIPREALAAEVARLSLPAGDAPVSTSAPRDTLPLEGNFTAPSPPATLPGRERGVEMGLENWAPPQGETMGDAEARFAEWLRISETPEEELPNQRARIWISSYPRSSEYRMLARQHKTSAV